MLFRFLTAGESHGPCLNVIIDGMPSGVVVDIDYINEQLARRMVGYGRGGRMKIESDKADILGGIRAGKTTGAPVCIQIRNKDWTHWSDAMTPFSIAGNAKAIAAVQAKKIVRIRPGHADLPGALKYDQEDIRNILERSSARETAARVAAGAVAKCVLNYFGIEGISVVTRIGKAASKKIYNPFEFKNDIEKSDLRTADSDAYELMKREIDAAVAQGDTLGGSFRVIYKNIPPGLGSHVQWDRKLDGKLAQAIMSIQAVKAVEVGMGTGVAQTPGSKTHDEIFVKNNKLVRKTNNAGGIEGGISNGENIIIRASMKAIPTMLKPLKSAEIDTKKESDAHFERSDTCAVPACAVVGEAMTAIVLADAIFDKFSHDSIFEMLENYDRYIQKIGKRQ